MNTRILAGMIAVALGCARDAAAQARIWAPDERVVITSFNDVLAIAYDGQRVFGATRNGLEIYDAIARRWLTPSTVEDGYPVFEQPAATGYDRTQGGLWLVTTTGNTYLWSELNGRWDSRMPGSAPRDVLRPAQPPTNDPAWRVLRGTMTLDPATGRRWPITAVTPADRPGTFWAATGGGNIIAADTRNLSAQWLTFGTLARGVSALARTAEGDIWFGGDGLGPRDGLTRVDSTLQNWNSFEAYSTRAPRRAIKQILAGDTTWVAAVDGLYVLPLRARSWHRIDERSGLPSLNVRAIARAAHGVWVGTQRGVAVVDAASLDVAWRGMEGVRVNGLAVRADTVWIASDAGVFIGVGERGTYRVLTAPGTDARPQLRRQVAAIANIAGRIAAIGSDGLWLYDREWSILSEAAHAGRPYDLRADAQRLFVLTPNALAEWDAKADSWRMVTVPADVPEGPIRDVIRTGEFLWLATPGGAVRLRLP